MSAICVVEEPEQRASTVSREKECALKGITLRPSKASNKGPQKDASTDLNAATILTLAVMFVRDSASMSTVLVRHSFFDTPFVSRISGISKHSTK